MATLLILTAASLYGISPILVKVAYAYAVPTILLLALRSTLSTACLWIGLAATRAWVPPPRASIAPLLAIGTTLLPIQVFAFFYALVDLPASTASVLTYTYPLNVAWMGWVFLGERLESNEIAVLLGVVGGAALVAGGTPNVWHGPGLISIAVATVGYAAYIVIARRVIRNVSAVTAMSILLPTSAAAYWCAALLAGQIRLPIPLPAALAIAGSGVLATLIAPLLLLSGLRRTPAVRAAMLGMLEPVTTVTLSVLLLGDRIGLLRASGIAIVLGGIVVLLVQQSAQNISLWRGE